MDASDPELKIVQSECLEFLTGEPDEKYDLIYIDPPFNTGQRRVSSRDRALSYSDSFDDFVSFIRPRLVEARRVLKESGSIYVHLDHHSIFDVKPVMDDVFGKKNFLNHIVWSYNYGGRGRDRWPQKHDDILFYAKRAGSHHFDWDAIDRIPYKVPELQHVGRTREEAEKRIAWGQVPTDVWEISIVGTNSHERTGYPTQKPRKLVERIIRASCPKGGVVLDFFAGSGTTGEAAKNVGCAAVLVDSNPQAIEVMHKRLVTGIVSDIVVLCDNPGV